MAVETTVTLETRWDTRVAGNKVTHTMAVDTKVAENMTMKL